MFMTTKHQFLFLYFDCDSLRITAYRDEKFAQNIKLSSLFGQIVLLTYDDYNSIPVSYKSYKSRRVARSVLSAKVIALQTCLMMHLQSAINCNLSQDNQYQYIL